jgi:hypothetical protein
LNRLALIDLLEMKEISFIRLVNWDFCKLYPYESN